MTHITKYDGVGWVGDFVLGDIRWKQSLRGACYEPEGVGIGCAGERRTMVIYCDPNASYQKPNVELNHEFIRRILPKESTFDHLAQDDINRMMSHINSYSMEKLNEKTPYDLFGFLYGYSVLDKLS